jgi:hypothetical protein
VAFSSTTTIYPNVSDTRNGEKTTIYPYTMSSSDVPRRPYDRGRAIQSRGSSRDAYANKAREAIAAAGSYVAWLDELELASPSAQPGAVIGGTALEYRAARRAAQAAYDTQVGIASAADAQVAVGDSDGTDLGAALDAIGDTTEGIVEKARRNPGATAAIVGGAILLFLLARRR